MVYYVITNIGRRFFAHYEKNLTLARKSKKSFARRNVRAWLIHRNKRMPRTLTIRWLNRNQTR